MKHSSVTGYYNLRKINLFIDWPKKKGELVNFLDVDWLRTGELIIFIEASWPKAGELMTLMSTG